MVACAMIVHHGLPERGASDLPIQSSKDCEGCNEAFRLSGVSSRILCRHRAGSKSPTGFGRDPAPGSAGRPDQSPSDLRCFPTALLSASICAERSVTRRITRFCRRGKRLTRDRERALCEVGAAFTTNQAISHRGLVETTWFLFLGSLGLGMIPRDSGRDRTNHCALSRDRQAGWRRHGRRLQGPGYPSGPSRGAQVSSRIRPGRSSRD